MIYDCYVPSSCEYGDKKLSYVQNKRIGLDKLYTYALLIGTRQ